MLPDPNIVDLKGQLVKCKEQGWRGSNGYLIHCQCVSRPLTAERQNFCIWVCLRIAFKFKNHITFWIIRYYLSYYLAWLHPPLGTGKRNTFNQKETRNSNGLKCKTESKWSECNYHRWECCLIGNRWLHWSFTDQGKQTSVFCFCLQQTNGSFLFPFSICRKQMKVAVFHGHGDIETWTHG
jgi:hypothetical protein